MQTAVAASDRKHRRANAVFMAAIGLLMAAFAIAIASCSAQPPGSDDKPATSLAEMPPAPPAGVNEAIASVQQRARERDVTLTMSGTKKTRLP